MSIVQETFAGQTQLDSEHAQIFITRLVLSIDEQLSFELIQPLDLILFLFSESDQLDVDVMALHDDVYVDILWNIDGDGTIALWFCLQCMFDSVMHELNLDFIDFVFLDRIVHGVAFVFGMRMILMAIMLIGSSHIS